MHFPAKYRMYLTKRMAEQLCGCRARMPPILEAQHRPQGLGLSSDQKPPQTTVDTWQTVSNCLDYLCDQWTQAESSNKPTSGFCGREPKTALNALLKALEKEEKRHEATDPVCYEREHAHKPYRAFPEALDHVHRMCRPLGNRFTLRRCVEYQETTHLIRRAHLFERWKMVHSGDWGDAPEVEAYRALLVLQEYTVNRKWSTAEGFGNILSDRELKETEENFTRYIKPIWETQDLLFYPDPTQPQTLSCNFCEFRV